MGNILENFENIRCSRRDFLKWPVDRTRDIALASAALSLVGCVEATREPSVEEQEAQKQLEYISPSMLFIDFSVQKPGDDVHLLAPVDNLGVWQQAIRGVRSPNSIKQAIIGSFAYANGFNDYSTHGLKTVGASRSYLAQHGYRTDYFHYPLQNILADPLSSIEIEPVDDGRLIVETEISPEAIVNHLNNLPDTFPLPKMIVLPFQVGRMVTEVIFKDEHGDFLPKPIYVSSGAYYGSHAYENIKGVNMIANSFSSSEVFFAAGNQQDSYSKINEQLALEGIAATNANGIAEWGEADSYHIDGALLYIPNEQLGFPRGASYSTPIYPSALAILQHHGLTVDTGIASIREHSSRHMYFNNGIATVSDGALFDENLFDTYLADNQFVAGKDPHPQPVASRRY
ncbi:MAG: hypothetical protein NUV98_05765 [Candidatus Roizmanbacteria bacterium]|nr:hypothetical protein [Candidatus Roizmanbacteria bacterium]